MKKTLWIIAGIFGIAAATTTSARAADIGVRIGIGLPVASYHESHARRQGSHHHRKHFRRHASVPRLAHRHSDPNGHHAHEHRRHRH